MSRHSELPIFAANWRLGFLAVRAGCRIGVRRALANGEEEEAGAGLAVPRELQMLEKSSGVQS